MENSFFFFSIDEEAVIQFGNDVTWYIPLGLREWFIERGIDNVIELDWWQEIHHKGRPDILIACIPSMVSNFTRSRKKKKLMLVIIFFFLARKRCSTRFNKDKSL